MLFFSLKCKTMDAAKNCQEKRRIVLIGLRPMCCAPWVGEGGNDNQNLLIRTAGYSNGKKRGEAEIRGAHKSSGPLKEDQKKNRDWIRHSISMGEHSLCLKTEKCIMKCEMTYTGCMTENGNTTFHSWKPGWKGRRKKG